MAGLLGHDRAGNHGPQLDVDRVPCTTLCSVAVDPGYRSARRGYRSMLALAHRIVDNAKAGDETVAASSVPTVQQIGFGLGAAITGLVD